MSRELKPFRFRPGDTVVEFSSGNLFVVVTGYLRRAEGQPFPGSWYKVIERGGGEFKEIPEDLLESLEARVARRLMGE